MKKMSFFILVIVVFFETRITKISLMMQYVKIIISYSKINANFIQN